MLLQNSIASFENILDMHFSRIFQGVERLS